MATQPTLVSAAFSTSVAGQVLVQFNTNVSSTDATTSGNYSIPGLTVTGATYNATTFVATLTVTGYSFGTSYTLTASSIKDSTNTLTIAAPGNTVSFINGISADRSTAIIAPTEVTQWTRPQQTWSTPSVPLGSGSSGTTRHQGSKTNPGFN